MIFLDDYVDSGRFRDAYIHPEDDQKIIKVTPQNSVDDNTRRKPGFWHFYTLRPKFPSAHQRELMGMARLKKKRLLSHPYFATYHGEVMTNKGPGIVVERITNFYFDDMLTVYDYLQKHQGIKDPKLRMALEGYLDFLIQHQLLIAGGAPENIAIVRDEEGEIAVKSFDAKTIPIRDFLSFLWVAPRDRRRLQRQKKIILEYDRDRDKEALAIVKRQPPA